MERLVGRYLVGFQCATGQLSAAPVESSFARFWFRRCYDGAAAERLGDLADINLTQADADALLAMEKHKADDAEHEYPSLGGSIRVPLVSPDRREAFFLDVMRSQVKLTKGTYQHRGRGVVVLARLDFGGAPHRNPDDEQIPCPHLHVYREGFGDRWAVPLPTNRFSDAGDPWLLLLEFMQFVNITMPPNIRRGLFT